MVFCSRPLLFMALFVAVMLSGCAGQQPAERSTWRAQVESVCLAANPNLSSAFVQPAAAIEGPNVCGLGHPFKVTALAGGTVAFEAEQTLDCSMVTTLDTWVAQVLQPAAQASFGQPVVAIRAMDSYNCRNANNDPFARYSEHAFGNAIDMSGFRFADGRELRVVRDWSGSDPAARAFLRMVHGGGCDLFSTALGPGYPHHENHFHFDLAQRASSTAGAGRFCKPLPRPTPSNAPVKNPASEPQPSGDEIARVVQAGDAATPVADAAPVASTSGEAVDPAVDPAPTSSLKSR